MKQTGTLGLSAILFAIGTLFVSASSLSFAQEPSEPAGWVAANAPDSYIVKNGDTLWDVACMFLNDPWRWKQVWCANPDIENPNLIYPGDKLILKFAEGKPQIHVERGTSWRTIDKRTGIVKLRPRVRSFPAEKPIPTISLSVIGPFLNQSRVVNANQALNSPVIVGLDDEHIVVGTGDRIFVTGLSPRIPDSIFSIFRPGKEYIDPDTKCCLGIEGNVLGKAEREVFGITARLLILQSFSEIKVGDRLIGTLEEELDAYFIPKAPEDVGRGKIISVFEGISQIGQYQIVVLTGGCDKSREVGDVLAISQTMNDVPSRYLFEQDKNYQFPPMKIGSCIVFRVFDKVSYALVMDAIRPINLLDDVASP